MVTGNPHLAARVRAISDFGIGSVEPCIGTNAKLSEYHAAVGLASMSTWDAQSQERQALYRFYKDEFVLQCGPQLTFQADTGHVAPCIFPVLLPNSTIREDVETICRQRGVGTRRWYLPLIQHLPMLSAVEVAGSCETAKSIEDRLVGLPFSIDLDRTAIQRVVEAVTPRVVSAAGNRHTTECRSRGFRSP